MDGAPIDYGQLLTFLLQKLGGGAGQIAQNFEGDYHKRLRDSVDALKRDATAPVGPQDMMVPGAPSERMGALAGDVAGFLSSPIQGATDTIIGRPAAALTKGKVSKEQAGDLAAVMIPGPEELAVPAELRKIVGFDNPGGEWLKSKQAAAKAALAERPYPAVQGPITAYTREAVHVDPRKVARFPGAMNEMPMPGNGKYDRVAQSFREKGWDPEEGGAIVIGVNHEGNPFIVEGNHRAAAARDVGLKSIPAEIRWYAGGEQAGGFSPRDLHRLRPDEEVK